MQTAKLDKQTSTAARRGRILEAARKVFEAKGGLGAGLRPIAAAAGCTTGAIYAVFSSKEDIYAALLHRSLRELANAVAGAAAREAAPERALVAAASVFYDYYQSHKFEYSLGMYLFEQDGRKGLGSERDRELNRLLAETLAVFCTCFERLGAREDDPELTPTALANALFGALIGVVAMAVSRRDRSLGTQASTVLTTIIHTQLRCLFNNTVT